MHEQHPCQLLDYLTTHHLESLGDENGKDADTEEDEKDDEVKPDAGECAAEEDAEGRRMRGPSTPYVPTDKERQEHNLTHYPHRTWCECCMAGRAIAGRHSAKRARHEQLACYMLTDDTSP